MNSFPFRTERGEFSSHCRPDLDYFRNPKSGLLDQPHRAMGTIQLKPRPRSAAPDRVDMRWRVVVGIYHQANVSDR
jgi:hypothetical protein